MRNPSPYPLQYDLDCVDLEGLRIGKHRFSGTIPPEGKEILEIPVSRKGQTPAPEKAGVRVSVDCRIPLRGQACFEKSFISDAIIPVPAPGGILGMNTDEARGAEFILDDDLSTYWTAFGQNARFLYVLPEERPLSSIALAFFKGDKRQAKFEIRGSRDLTDWEPLFEGQSSGKTNELEEFRFEKPATVRYLYFIGHGNTTNQWNSVLEMALTP